MARNQLWFESCGRLMNRIAHVMRHEQVEHKKISPSTYIDVQINRRMQGTHAFDLRSRIAFCSITGKEDIVKNLHDVNLVNEAMVGRYVSVHIINKEQAKLLGNPEHPFQITYTIISPYYGVGYTEASMCYSEDTVSISRGNTWDAELAGQHIFDFLVRGVLEGDVFPNRS